MLLEEYLPPGLENNMFNVIEFIISHLIPILSKTVINPSWYIIHINMTFQSLCDIPFLSIAQHFTYLANTTTIVVKGLLAKDDRTLFLLLLSLDPVCVDKLPTRSSLLLKQQTNSLM